MYRIAYEELLKWKDSPGRKPLIVEGARQVGKTYLLREFGKKEYKNMIYVNCDNNPEIQDLFVDYNIDRIIRFLSSLYATKISEEDTLIIFDEVQEHPRGLAALKYFCEDSNYSVAVAGSLLGLSLHEGTGFPVGKVDIINLYPLSFEEFLLAFGQDILVEELNNGSLQENAMYTHMMEDYLRQYYYVGGMPKVVDQYVHSADILNVRKTQMEILESYQKDFSKHTTKNMAVRINAVWKSLPSQLAKENKKFIFGHVREGARAKDFEDAIYWLEEAGLVHKVSRVTKICEPLKFYEDIRSFKLFCCDIGLLGALVDAKAASFLANKSGFVEYKGAFTEQFVAQEFIANNGGKNLFYYTKDNSRLEVDFLFEKERLYLVEVKAEKNLCSKSLSTALEMNNQAIGLRYSMAGYEKQEQLVNIPLSFAGFSLKRDYPEIGKDRKEVDRER